MLGTRLDGIIDKITGLKNSSILILGMGFVREEYKALCFKLGKGLNQFAIQNAKSIAQNFVPESRDRLLDASARVELLRETFKNPNLKSGLPVLLEHRFRPKFFENLDRALQHGRRFFAHLGEASVLQERLEERLGRSEKREEFFLLNRLWENVLLNRELWDEARLYEDAALRSSQGVPFVLKGVTLFKLEHLPDPPRLQFFWSSLAQVMSVESDRPKERAYDSQELFQMRRACAHSLEDAAHFLFDHFIEKEIENPGSIQRKAIVIPDEPAIRRTLKRVMESRGLQLNDPRDPTQIVQSEEIKLALLELEMVAKGFPSSLVLTWLGVQQEFLNELGFLRKQIIEKGIVQGVNDYQVFPLLYQRLKEIDLLYPKKINLQKLQELIQKSIHRYGLALWVKQLVEKVFHDWEQSFQQIQLPGSSSTFKELPIRHLAEQLNEKLKQATPIVSPLKKEGGVYLFRVDQSVNPHLFNGEFDIHFFGIGRDFFEPKEEGTDWFSARDLEILSMEFSIPSIFDAQLERMKSFLAWCQLSKNEKFFWDFLYDESGSECESVELYLTESKRIEWLEKLDLGLHPRLKNSLLSQLKVQKAQVQIQLPKDEWPISFLNAYGNCAFTAYSAYLLNLFDERETDFELKGDSFGNLVHAALELLLKENLDCDSAFERAWQETKQIAWLKSSRLQSAIRNKTLLLLQAFKQSEEEYLKKSGTHIREMEYEVKWQKNGIVWKGRVDRIDQHQDGLIVIDYKTSSLLPSGRKTLEKGMGLQLPIYALAIKERLNQEVVAAQYLHLTPHKVNRNIGVLFQQWNQSKVTVPIEFAITHARSNSQSLFEESPEELWNQFDERISSLIFQLKQGYFSAKPADPEECSHCRYILVCGKLRGGSDVFQEDSIKN